MPLLAILALALVQGLAEPLPLSAAAHLTLVSRLFGWSAQPPLLLLAGHAGVALALAVALRQDLWRLARGAMQILRGRKGVEKRLVWHLVLATLPAAIGFGLILVYGAPLGGGVLFMAWAALGGGAILLVVDRFGMTIRRGDHMTAIEALVLGVAQLLAFIPGASRSAATMTTARLLGYERAEAARFALLMAIPAILGASAFAGYGLLQTGELRWRPEVAIVGGAAFLAALVATTALRRWLRRGSFAPLALYRLLVAGAVLIWLTMRG